ncbi:hypothetical protein COU61_04010, partial [Candidatus Pacearchaeota archaeon CG10_big_fil_rev_8_21_14_0_10_35_13]
NAKFSFLIKKKQKDGNPHFLFLEKKETKKAHVSLIHSPPKKYYFRINKNGILKNFDFLPSASLY